MPPTTAPIRVSYDALDVGFDVRRHPAMRIALPAGGADDVYSVSYATRESTRTVIGDRARVTRVLRRHGYRVAD